MRILPFLLVLLGLPLAEIAVFVAVGSEIGVGWTLLLVVLSFVIGVAAVRRSSLSTLQAVRAEARLGRVPERELAVTAVTVLAALLLMVPGLITSAFGLLLLLPPVRDTLLRAMGRRIVVRTQGMPGARGRGTRAPARAEIVDLEEDEFERRGEPDPQTPWRRVDEDREGPR